jgi:MATE family multidrug resistance protein
VSNATVPLLGIVDTAVVGQLGDPVPIGAVGLGAIILSSVYWVFGFLRMGTVGLAAQALGARDAAEVAALLTRVLMIGAGAGLAMILLQVPIIAAALWLSPASAEVEALVRTYISIRVFSAPAAIAIYGITGWLIAQERTGASLHCNWCRTGSTSCCRWVLVLAFDLGVAGVAWATFVAEWAGLALGLWLCQAGVRRAGLARLGAGLRRAKLWRMAAVNVDILIRSLLLMAGFTSFLFFAADFGDVTLAANQVLIQFVYITAYAMDGFAFAAEALVGHAMGRGRGGTTAAAAGADEYLGCGRLRGDVARVLAVGRRVHRPDDDTAVGVRAEARVFLPWMIAGPLVGCASWMFDGIFIGATRTRDMRNMMAVSFAGYVVMVALFVPVWDNHGLWAAMLGFFALRGLTLGLALPGAGARGGVSPDYSYE